jgi:hypothetical protein
MAFGPLSREPQTAAPPPPTRVHTPHRLTGLCSMAQAARHPPQQHRFASRQSQVPQGQHRQQNSRTGSLLPERQPAAHVADGLRALAGAS